MAWTWQEGLSLAPHHGLVGRDFRLNASEREIELLLPVPGPLRGSACTLLSFWTTSGELRSIVRFFWWWGQPLWDK